MSKSLKRLLWFTPLALLAGTVCVGAAYVTSGGLSLSMKEYVERQLEERGIHLTLESITVAPMEGLVARGIVVYQDGTHRVEIASVDRLNLDLDYARLMRKEVNIEAVDLRDASVSFPFDPDDEKSERITLKKFNARVQLQGDRVDIRRADGVLGNLHISITGSVLRPQPARTPEEERLAELRNREQILSIKAHRKLLVEAAKQLQKFETKTQPQLDIEVSGDLGKPEDLNASVHLTATGLKHSERGRSDYVCQELEAKLTCAGRLVDLSSLRLKDRLGELEVSASYEIGAEFVDFHMRSGVDLPALAWAVLQKESLRDVVFYEPVEVNADGRVLLGKAVPEDAFVPVECSGSVNAGRFESRGQMIEGASVNFGLSPKGCYFRDGLLRHKSGNLQLQAMWKKPSEFRYRAVVRLDPHIALPFFESEHGHEIIERFAFRDASSIYLEVEGEGASPDISQCKNTGHAELHHFKYAGVEFDRLEAEVAFSGTKHAYRNIRIERPEGTGTVKEAAFDEEKHMGHFTGVVTDIEVPTLISCFNRGLAANIAQYRIEPRPHAEMDGVLAFDNRPGTDVKIKFRGEGTGHYVLFDEDYTIHKPTGELTIKGPHLTYDVSGNVFNRDMTCKGNVLLGDDAHDYTVDLHAGAFPYQIFGKPMPFEKVTAMVDCKKGLVDFNIKAGIMDGDMTLRGRVDDRKPQAQPYEGELRFNAMSFKKFTQLYTPDSEPTEGDVTGHAEFTGRLGGWKSLNGKGTLVILNSNLYSVPILGPLTPLLGALLPKPIKGYNVAKEANATFNIADGFATTNDLEALTGVFRIEAKGKIDFLEDKIFFHAQSKFRGLPGLVLFPVSRILEYTGEGSVEKTVWRPRFFSLPGEGTEMRKPDDPANPASPNKNNPSKPANPPRAGR